MRVESSLLDDADVLGYPFDLIDYEAVLDHIRKWRQCGERHYMALANPHSIMLARREGAMAGALGHASLILPDGIGIILAAEFLGYVHHQRVTGPTLMLRLCDWGRDLGLRHYFYGGAEGVAEALAAKLQQQYPGLEVAGTFCPPFQPFKITEDEKHLERINATEPDILWVGLGAPKQEKWMREHLGRVEATAMIGVGAAFDFHAGTAKWAPRWMRACGFEWTYRLVCEPRRMWPRNLDNAAFVAAVFAQKLKGIAHYFGLRPDRPQAKNKSVPARSLRDYR